MFNVLYDFVDLTPYVPPYIGAGVGYQGEQVIICAWSRRQGLPCRPARVQGGFAYQGIAGVAFPVSPALALTIDYRFMGLTGNHNYGAAVLPWWGGHAANLSSAATTTTWLSLGSVCVQCAAASDGPAPAVVAPSPISRSYLVFFDWDKAI